MALTGSREWFGKRNGVTRMTGAKRETRLQFARRLSQSALTTSLQVVVSERLRLFTVYGAKGALLVSASHAIKQQSRRIP